MYRLLICDDEPLERIALRKMIGRRFSDITILDDAATGEEAIAGVRLYLPDILLMDIRMPEKNGLDAQKQIIEIHPGIHTVIITAYSDFDYAQEAIKYRVFDFLLKPVSPAALYDCIQKILDEDASPLEKRKKAGSDDFGGGVIRDAIGYIDANFLKNLRLQDVAARVNLSPKYFSRYFKTQTGHTFTSYVNMRKVERAKSFLLHTKAPIYKIAMDLNFSDSAYFSKVFYKYEHMTPLQYRKKGGYE